MRGSGGGSACERRDRARRPGGTHARVREPRAWGIARTGDAGGGAPELCCVRCGLYVISIFGSTAGRYKNFARKRKLARPRDAVRRRAGATR